MKRESYKKGSTSASGHLVESVLGQSQRACVFTTRDSELRWEYYANVGQLPPMARRLLDQFDRISHQIGLLQSPASDKKELYQLLGKRLFLALDGPLEGERDSHFSDVEREVLRQQMPRTDSRFDIAVLCALNSPELSSLTALDGSVWEELPPDGGDTQTYQRTTWTSQNGTPISVVAAAPTNMGPTSAGALAAKMVWRFRPHLVGMTGIAAGVDIQTQGFGDVLVPNQTFDLGAAKLSLKDGELALEYSANNLSVDATMLTRLKRLEMDPTHLEEITRSWRGKLPRTRLSYRIGPLFSSPAVVGTRHPITEAARMNRKLVGIEMEAHAVHRACNDTVSPAPLFCCMKSICDFGEGKSDDWQAFAAYTSACAFRSFVERDWSVLAATRP